MLFLLLPVSETTDAVTHLVLTLTLTFMLTLILILVLILILLQARKQERSWKQAADEHTTAALALESKLAGKQREVADLQELNTSLFARFQSMRQQLARSEDKLSHDKLRGDCNYTQPCASFSSQTRI